MMSLTISAPATHMLKPVLWWSRPLLFSFLQIRDRAVLIVRDHIHLDEPRGGSNEWRTGVLRGSRARSRDEEESCGIHGKRG
jgi:hypothetical protein